MYVYNHVPTKELESEEHSLAAVKGMLDIKFQSASCIESPSNTVINDHRWLDRNVPLPYVSSVFFFAFTMLGCVSVNSCTHQSHNVSYLVQSPLHGIHVWQDILNAAQSCKKATQKNGSIASKGPCHTVTHTTSCTADQTASELEQRRI